MFRYSLCRLNHIRSLMILVAVLGGLISGCGIKGPPVPPPQYRPTAVDDLRFSLEDGNLLLAWTIPSVSEKSKFNLAGCTVYRSVRPLEEGDCKNCPVQYKKVTDIPRSAPGVKDPSTNEMNFRETLTISGDYSYKVVCFTEQGAVGESSNVVNFTY